MKTIADAELTSMTNANDNALTNERLLAVLRYDPGGLFVWRQSLGRAKAGSVAGAPHEGGYLVIRIGEQSHRAHQPARR